MCKWQEIVLTSNSFSIQTEKDPRIFAERILMAERQQQFCFVHLRMEASNRLNFNSDVENVFLSKRGRRFASWNWLERN